MIYKLLKLTKQQLQDLLPQDISNVPQYIQSGGLYKEKSYKLNYSKCGQIDCLKPDCSICRQAINLWRKAVKERDRYTCKTCGTNIAVQAHHLLQRVNFPERAFDINNGTTLCATCHRLAHAPRRSQ